jgi:Mrp family chromosome partitioning ATPase
MIASALSGEGKTFTCMNLCLSIAREKDWDVVLVDGDCTKPHLTKLFGAEDELGLLDLLRDPALRFDSLVMPTNLPGFSFLPAGKADEQAAELLASARMSGLCTELSSGERHRVIVFDSAPLLLTAESTALASQVGQIVLVVHANRTPQHAVLQARDKLDESKAISVLLNQGDADRHLGTYGGYHSYAP